MGDTAMPHVPRIFAVICARNESATIADVIATFRAPECRDIIEGVVVVNDFSTDDTALVAQRAGAVVITPTKHRGKGAAMKFGYTYALSHDATHVFFADADLRGFTTEHVRRMVNLATAPATKERPTTDMVCGLRDYGPWLNWLQYLAPTITGERIVSARLLRSGLIPAFAWDGYATETALGVVCWFWYFVARDVMLKGHGIVYRHQKVRRSVWASVREYANLARTVLRTMVFTAWWCTQRELDGASPARKAERVQETEQPRAW